MSINVSSNNAFGLKLNTISTPHTSKTIMVDELSLLIGDSSISFTSAQEVRNLALSENLLRKQSSAAKENAIQRLIAFYALDDSIAVFRLLKHFWKFSQANRHLLAIQCATSRDPLLRISADYVLSLTPGQPFEKDKLKALIVAETKGHFGENTTNSMVRNLASSWTQSGHLLGKTGKKRSKVVATVENVAYAIAIGYLSGVRSDALYTSLYARMTDLSNHQIDSMLHESSRRGWINYRRTGSVLDIDIRPLLTSDELRLLNE